MSKEFRKTAILEDIQRATNGMTLNELRDIHGMSYYTIRNYVQEFVRDGKVRETTELRQRAVVYRVGEESQVPMWLGKPIWNHVSLQAQYLKKKPTDRPEAVHASSMGFRRFCYRVARLYAHAHAVYEETNKVTGKDLAEVREGLIANKRNLEELIQAHNTLINDERLWDPTKFAKLLLSDKKYPANVAGISDVHTTISDIAHKRNGLF